MSFFKTILAVFLVLLSAGLASAQEYEEDDVRYGAVGEMSTTTLAGVVDLRQESKGYSIFATGRYKIGLSMSKGPWTATVSRFRENIPISPKTVLNPELVYHRWGWEGEGYYAISRGPSFDWGPVGSASVSWLDGEDHKFSFSGGIRLGIGPVILDGTVAQSVFGPTLGVGFGLRLR